MPAVEKVCDGERINALEIVRDILIAEDFAGARIVLGTHPDSAEALSTTVQAPAVHRRQSQGSDARLILNFMTQMGLFGTGCPVAP